MAVPGHRRRSASGGTGSVLRTSQLKNRRRKGGSHDDRGDTRGGDRTSDEGSGGREEACGGRGAGGCSAGGCRSGGRWGPGCAGTGGSGAAWPTADVAERGDGVNTDADGGRSNRVHRGFGDGPAHHRCNGGCGGAGRGGEEVRTVQKGPALGLPRLPWGPFDRWWGLGSPTGCSRRRSRCWRTGRREKPFGATGAHARRPRQRTGRHWSTGRKAAVSWEAWRGGRGTRSLGEGRRGSWPAESFGEGRRRWPGPKPWPGCQWWRPGSARRELAGQTRWSGNAAGAGGERPPQPHDRRSVEQDGGLGGGRHR